MLVGFPVHCQMFLFLHAIGNISHPNTFSYNLLTNIGHLAGTNPYIRVGGNTQDYALYNASLKEAINGTYNLARSPDYPTTIFIGPSYFESYHTWPNTKYSHGFNMGLGGNNSAGWETLLETVPLACKALGGGKLLWWEYGNEPDLYSTSSQGPVRPPTWNESTYVEQWLNATRAIKSQLAKACPDMLSNKTYGYMAPSFAGVSNHLKPTVAFADDLDADEDIRLISIHKYDLPLAYMNYTDRDQLYRRCNTAGCHSSRNANEPYQYRALCQQSRNCSQQPSLPRNSIRSRRD